MYYKYGTAGFRCKSELLKDISIKIGEILAILCYNKNKKVSKWFLLENYQVTK